MLTLVVVLVEQLEQQVLPMQEIQEIKVVQVE
jgi:hypothetical protein